MTSYFKTKRIVDKKYLDSFRNKSCCICGNPNSVAHHVRSLGGGTGLKPSDNCCIPLDSKCHELIHNNEKEFLNKHSRVFGDDIKAYAEKLYSDWLLTK